MLKITRTSLLPQIPYDEPSSASKVTLVTKRGFKANTSASLLFKRHSVEVDNQVLERIKSFHGTKSRSGSTADESSESSGSDQANNDSKNDLDDCSESTELRWSHSSHNGFNESQMKKLSEKFFRVMVVGSRDIGKRSFVHKLFSASPSTKSLPKQFFDLITKVINEGSCIKRYHFWLKELNEMEKDYKLIIDVYYKTCSAFFLIYDPEDENSYDILQKEVEMLTSVNEGCSIILLAKSKADDDPNKISEELVQKLKVKYGQRMYYKTLTNLEPSKDLLDIIDQFSKYN